MAKFIISLIRYYQSHGPAELHNACLFTPTCSEYMILAIQKYGCTKGILKGIGRLLRCHQPNGGVDYP